MDSITAKFQRSYVCLQKFLNTWTGEIQDRCLVDEQRKASFYVWVRYTISIRTLHQISDPHYIPDIYIIGRSCLEYHASLMGVMADPQLATKYLEFPDRSRAYIAKVLARLGYTTWLAKEEPYLRKIFGDDWRKEARPTWHNISNLIENYLGPEERFLYWWGSQFTHGTSLSIENLQRTKPTLALFDKIIKVVFLAYGQSTRDFLDFAWGPVITDDSQNCKDEFRLNVMAAFI